jgi:autotransporter-associated beta strand protein
MSITSSGTALTTISGGVTGAFNLTLNANSSGNITLSGTSVNNGGTITNSGSSTGTTTISAVIGSSVTGVTQNSAGSTLALGTSANTYSGGTTIAGGNITIGGSGTPLGSGTLTLSGGTLVTTASRSTALSNNISVTADSAITTTSNSAATLPFSGTLTGTGGTLTIRNDGSATVAQFDVRFSGGDYTMSRPIVIDNGAGGGTARLSDFNTTGTTHTYNGIISGNGSYNRSASVAGTGGTTIFNANNTYTGTTAVSQGATLLINGNQSAATGAVTVNNSGTTLGGGGTIGGTVNVASGSNLSPGTTGNGTGNTAILNTGALTLASGSNFVLDLNSAATAGTGYDKVISSGAIVLTGANIVITASNSISLLDKFYVLSNSSATTNTGTFAQGATVTANNGYIFTINYLDSDPADGTVGNDISLTLTAIPEPSTWGAAALALLVVGYMQRKRFSKS